MRPLAAAHAHALVKHAARFRKRLESLTSVSQKGRNLYLEARNPFPRRLFSLQSLRASLISKPVPALFDVLVQTFCIFQKVFLQSSTTSKTLIRIRVDVGQTLDLPQTLMNSSLSFLFLFLHALSVTLKLQQTAILEKAMSNHNRL